MKSKLLLFLLLVFLLPKVNAQNAIVVAGGNASGSGGSSSYSIGQIAYSYQTGTNGSVAEGVQHAFEIFTLNGQEFTAILLEAKAFPNPVVNALTLSIKNVDFQDLTYQLYNIQGKLIKNETIQSEETTINLENNAAGIYVLKINSNTKPIKSFKIIKN